MYNYHLFEDNAGYLHLAVLNDASTCVYCLVGIVCLLLYYIIRAQQNPRKAKMTAKKI